MQLVFQQWFVCCMRSWRNTPLSHLLAKTLKLVIECEKMNQYSLK